MLAVANAQTDRTKRQSGGELLLPDGVEFLLAAPLQSTFRCEGAGYYADIDNNCQIFHICDVQVNQEGLAEVRQYSFACGNQTIFNQLTLTCALPDDSIPCNLAPQFYPINQRIGQPNVLLHTEEEVALANQYIPSRSAGALPARSARSGRRSNSSARRQKKKK